MSAKRQQAFRLPEDLIEQIEDAADRLGSKTTVVETALEEFFADDDGEDLAEKNQELRARIESLEERNAELSERVPDEAPKAPPSSAPPPPKEHECDECGRVYRYPEVAEQCARDDRDEVSPSEWQPSTVEVEAV